MEASSNNEPFELQTFEVNIGQKTKPNRERECRRSKAKKNNPELERDASTLKLG